MKEKKKRSSVHSFKTTATLAVLLAAVVFMGSCAGIAGTETKQSTIPITSAAENETTAAAAESYVRMMCAGDNLIHENIYQQAKERSLTGGYDFTFAYKQVEQILELADFAVLNQETVIDKTREPSTFPLFNSPQELGEHMIKIGFSVINHANNHVIDKGVDGALKTIEFWKSHEGIVLTGVYRDEDDRNEVKINTVNGIRFAHVGFTEYLNGNRLPESAQLKVVSPVGANITRDEFFSTMKSMIERAKGQSDVVCASVHFQQEDSFTPSSTQQEIIDKLVEYGADVIIGTGPHVLQPMEFVQRKDGSRVLIIYSLGNFISAQSKAANMVSGIADVRFVKSNATGETKIISATLIPIVTHYTSGMRNIQIIPFADYSADLANNHGVRKYQPKYDYDYISSLLDEVIGADFLSGGWEDAE